MEKRNIYGILLIYDIIRGACMLVLNKKTKIMAFVIFFVLIVAAGYAIECVEKDAFVKETVAQEDDLPYTPQVQARDDGKININSADSAELTKLKGIGEALADRIIKFRSENGPFVTKEEIMKVSGISTKKFEEFKDDICTD